MGIRLTDDDEGVHAPGIEANWNESRYVGQDQRHLIFLPGQADFHYQHLAHVTGTITVRAGDVEWTVVGSPQNALPLRNRQTDADGQESTLRIVKYPAEWAFGDGRRASGHIEYHDLLRGGIPAGILEEYEENR